MLIYDDVSKKCDVIFKKFFALLKAFKLLSMCAKFLGNKWQFSILKKSMVGGNFTLTPRQRFRGQNMSVGIGLLKLTEPSDILN